MTVTRYTVIQDAGKAIHPSYVEGQYQGGAWGIGWAFEYIYGEDGLLQNPGFLDYRIGRVRRADDRHGDRGGAQPPPSLWRARRRRDADRPPMGAIANAVTAATGVRFTRLPMSPPHVLRG